jgi:hypothetical protein
MQVILLTIPKESVQHRPARSPFLSAADSSSLNSEDILALNHLIRCFSSGGSKLHRYFAASIDSAMLSKNIKNVGGRF